MAPFFDAFMNLFIILGTVVFTSEAQKEVAKYNKIETEGEVIHPEPWKDLIMAGINSIPDGIRESSKLCLRFDKNHCYNSLGQIFRVDGPVSRLFGSVEQAHFLKTHPELLPAIRGFEALKTPLLAPAILGVESLYYIGTGNIKEATAVVGGGAAAYGAGVAICPSIGGLIGGLIGGPVGAPMAVMGCSIAATWTGRYLTRTIVANFGSESENQNETQ